MRTPYPLLLLWPFSNEMAPDLVNGVNGRTLVTKFAPLLMEKLPGNQIEHKLFGFSRASPIVISSKLSRHHRILFGYLMMFCHRRFSKFTSICIDVKPYLEGALSAESCIFR